ncbi:MAG: hypothetical protein VYC34_08945, partial [Planctomycetota bacterium]|nr:hypothetical protein [Planctomycetota bacterium]
EARPGGPELESLVFEAGSATTTVGLSRGVTAELSDPGRVVVMLAGLLGRVGPLVMLAGIVSLGGRERTPIHFASEGVIMG